MPNVGVCSQRVKNTFFNFLLFISPSSDRGMSRASCGWRSLTPRTCSSRRSWRRRWRMRSSCRTRSSEAGRWQAPSSGMQPFRDKTGKILEVIRLMPRSHIPRAPYDFPHHPAACRGILETVRVPYDFHFYGVCGHILYGTRAVSGKNWWSVIARRPSTNRAHRKGAGRVPCGKLPGSVRLTGAPHGARLARPAGVRPGAMRCTVFVLRRPRILYSMPPWGGRTGNFVHQTGPGRQAPDVVHSSPRPLRGPVRWKCRENREQPAQHRGARTAGEKCPGARGNREGAGRAPYEIGQNLCFYSPYGPRSGYVT